MRRALLFTAVAAVIVFSLPAATGAAMRKTMNVTDCGVSVPRGTNAVLQTDIADCKPAFNANGITLAAGDAIDLNGHTIHYDDTLNGNAPIVCTGNCTVSNGTIVQDFQPFGVGSAIEASSKAHVTAHDVTFTNLANGVNVSLGTVDLKNVSMTVSVDGVMAAKTIRTDHVDITGFGTNQYGCLGGFVPKGRVQATDTTLTNCGGKAIEGSVKVVGLRVTISGGQSYGVFGKVVSLTDSSVTGSSLADIASGRLPAVQNTTCNISLKLPGPGSWHVCAGN